MSFVAFCGPDRAGYYEYRCGHGKKWIGYKSFINPCEECNYEAEVLRIARIKHIAERSVDAAWDTCR